MLHSRKIPKLKGHHVSDNNDVDVDEEGEKRAVVASVVGRGRRDGTQLLLVVSFGFGIAASVAARSLSRLLHVTEVSYIYNSCVERERCMQ